MGSVSFVLTGALVRSGIACSTQRIHESSVRRSTDQTTNQPMGSDQDPTGRKHRCVPSIS